MNGVEAFEADTGQLCPQCKGRSISVAVSMRDLVMFQCDYCKHEWESKFQPPEQDAPSERRIYVSVNQCPVHRGFYSVHVSGDPKSGSTRVTPVKCCGQWRELRGWWVDAGVLEMLIADEAGDRK